MRYKQLYDVLAEEVVKNKYAIKGTLNGYDLIKLLKTYTEYEVLEHSDLRRNHKAFENFVTEYAHLFQDGDECKDTTIYTYSYINEFNIFRKNSYEQCRKEQDEYVANIEKLIDFDKDIKILEVGGGNIPYSTLKLAEKGYNMSAMDYFYLSKKSFESLGVDAYNEKFDEDTPVDKFDLVIGKQPCYAIESISKACSKNNVPYFVVLCSCSAPGKLISNWKDVLAFHDPKVQLSKSFGCAYHVDKSMQERADEIAPEMK